MEIESIKSKNTPYLLCSIDFDFLNSPDFKELRNLAEPISVIGDSPYIIKQDEEEHKLTSLQEFADFVLDRGKKGQFIQRYKGLGEMNPEQLWETTMDPERRTLKLVTMENAAEADRIFSMLMGDEVPPRREFIEVNARYAKIDI